MVSFLMLDRFRDSGNFESQRKIFVAFSSSKFNIISGAVQLQETGLNKLILIGWCGRSEASYWSIFIVVTWPHLCQQVYHEKEQGRSWEVGRDSLARPGQDLEELLTTSCHSSPLRQAVSVLATSSCPDRVQLTTQYKASAAPSSRLPICNHSQWLNL